MPVTVSRGFSHLKPRLIAVFDVFTLLKTISTYIPSKRKQSHYNLENHETVFSQKYKNWG